MIPEDKIKHFYMSYGINEAFKNAAGLSPVDTQRATIGVGVFKELQKYMKESRQ